MNCDPVGGLQSLASVASGHLLLSHAQNKTIMEKQSRCSGWGGKRKGAGRPTGSLNRPLLIRGLPQTDDALLWLLALMNLEDAPLRLRVSAAVYLLPYFRTVPGH
jgi:hypothetical protein